MPPSVAAVLGTWSTVLESVRGAVTGERRTSVRRASDEERADGVSMAVPAVGDTDAIWVGDEDGADDQLDPAFRAAWEDRIAEIRDSERRLEVLAAHVGRDPEWLAFAVRPDGFVATDGRRRLARWPSEAAALADLAASSVLSECSPRYRGLPEADQEHFLAELRTFLRRCPDCEGPVVDGGTASVGTDGTRDGIPAVSVDLEAGAAERPTLVCGRCGSLLVDDRDRR